VTTDRLGPAYRAQSVRRLVSTTADAPLDALIIGGGVVGCGAALDAASRGLQVGLVEMNDLASGTSSRSSRLAHGGLRYLEQREFGLVREALTERGLLLDHLAPHLVHPVPFVFPVSKKWERPYVASGVRLYDVMSRVGSVGGVMPKPKSLSREELGALAPDLNLDEVTGGVTYYDAQIDDARHTVAVARTAASYGASIVTRTEVIALLRVTIDGEEHVNGARVKDTLTGETYDIYARVVISAAGVWTDQIRALLGGPPAAEVRQSKGVHLVIPRDAFHSSTAVIARTPASVLFLLPWGRNWLVGTTDTDWQGDLANPTADDADIDYLLDQANRWLIRPLRREDVVGVYAGLRPLVSDGNDHDATTSLSREHAIFRPTPGLVQIAGGKYTTYRVMAADVVDAAVTDLVSQGHSSVRESRTADIPLVGAAGYETDWAARAQIAEDVGLPVEVVTSLLRRHGGRVSEVLDLLADPTLAQPLIEGEPYLRAEIVHAGTHEAALAVEDVLIRRTRIALETRDGAKSAAVDAAELLGRALGWGLAEAERAAATYE